MPKVQKLFQYIISFFWIVVNNNKNTYICTVFRTDVLSDSEKAYNFAERELI